MKNVYYGKYFEYFEQGRSDLLRSLGMPYGELERQGLFLPVIEAFSRYKRPARYDELLQVETRLPEVPGARIRLEYSIVREGEAEVLVEGYTTHSFVDAQSGKPTRPPAMFLKLMNDAFKESKV
jgi:acyl-CoA thioester hydrolase